MSCDFPGEEWTGGTIITITFDDQQLSAYTNGLPLMNQYGLRATNFINTGLLGSEGSYGWAEAEELELVHGWETGGHSLSHCDLSLIDPVQAEQEISEDWMNLRSHGLSHDSFALPSGHAPNDLFDLITQYYSNIRTSRDISHHYPVNRYLLGYCSYDSDYTAEDIITRIINGILNNEDLIIIGFHKLSVDPEGHPCNCPPQEFEKILQFIRENDFQVLTIKEAMELLAE